MGLATIYPHSLREHTEIHKIPKFGKNRPNSKRDKAICKCQNFTKKCKACRKEHTEIHKIPKFGVNRLNNEQDTTI